MLTDDKGTYVEKDPSALLDYDVDWSANLAAGDAINAVVWAVEAGLTKASQTNTDTKATVWLSGGVAGATYAVACKITTTAGRTDERTFRVKVFDR